jgi:hypothetical protein
MKNAKLSLFVLTLTLSIGISSGVYACEENKDTNGVKPVAVTQKMEFKDAKNQKWDAKFLENHADKKNFDKNHKDIKKDKEDKCDKVKPVISVADKAALKVKKDKIVAVKDENKVLKTTIIKNAEAVKVELKRIEDSKIVLDPAVKTEADSVLLAVKDATTKKDCVKPVVTPVVPGSVVAPVVPIVAPTVPVVPVEKTYLEKLNEKLDKAFEKFTVKNEELTALGTRLLNLLNSLTLIK